MIRDWFNRMFARRLTPAPSYHDLFITTDKIARTPIFDLPYGIFVICTAPSGWEAWSINERDKTFLGGEYENESEDGFLVLDVGGHVICDSRQNSFS